MTTAEAQKIVKKDYPKAFGQMKFGRYYIFSGEKLPLTLAHGRTAAEAWERAAIEVNYSNGIGE